MICTHRHLRHLRCRWPLSFVRLCLIHNQPQIFICSSFRGQTQDALVGRGHERSRERRLAVDSKRRAIERGTNKQRRAHHNQRAIKWRWRGASRKEQARHMCIVSCDCVITCTHHHPTEVHQWSSAHVMRSASVHKAAKSAHSLIEVDAVRTCSQVSIEQV